MSDSWRGLKVCLNRKKTCLGSLVLVVVVDVGVPAMNGQLSDRHALMNDVTDIERDTMQ